ncbi:MAG TPA: exodeoxyribonuclease V subunit alpha, partial [Desulfobacterales bacterium]|nr:exodeoxyribonuclease V subunit alpha [Desulfobacterales bacterium]
VHWQSVAAALAARSAFTVVSGGPGTGKTTTVVQIIALLAGLAADQGRILRIALAAPTGKAAARLTESIRQAAARLPEELRALVPEEVTTLHRLLGRRPGSGQFTHNALCKLHIDLLVVDEASMVDMEMMAAVMAALPEKAALILLGDKDQLASVEAGSVLGDLCRRAERPGYRAETFAWLEKNTGYALREAAGEGGEIDQHIVILRHSHRFGPQSGIGALAAAVNAGDQERVENVWHDYTDINRLRLKSASPADERLAALILTGYRPFLELYRQGPEGKNDPWCRRLLEAFNHFQLLTPARHGAWGVEGLNHLTAMILYQAGLIAASEGWYVGRPVLVTRNDYSLGLMNGDIGLTIPADAAGSEDGGLRVVFQAASGELKKISPARLSEVETVYAMTVHKSQGSEFEHTVMALPEYDSPLLTRELIYTGITRAREKFTLIGCRPELLSAAVRRRTRRASGLGKLLG